MENETQNNDEIQSKDFKEYFLNEKWRVIIIFVLATTALSLLFFWLYNPEDKIKEIKKAQPTPGAHITIKQFGDVSDFVKSDMTDKDTTELRRLLSELRLEQPRLEKILKDAYNKSDPKVLANAFLEVEKIRDSYKEKILSFISENQKKDFEIYFQAEGTKLEDKYLSK